MTETDGEEVPYGDIRKGYELPDGHMMIIQDQDLADLPLPTKRVVDVVEFVPMSDINPFYFNKSYYLEPEKQGLKPYALLRDALAGSSMVAVVKVAISNREQLATIRVKDSVLVMATMLWPDEIRRPDFAFLDTDISVRPQELTMASTLISSMAATFDPAQYRDNFTEALTAMLEAKLEGHPVTTSDTAPTDSSAVGDLMTALKASVDKAKAARKKPPSRKRVSAKKDAAEQTSAASPAPAPRAIKKAPTKRPARKSA